MTAAALAVAGCSLIGPSAVPSEPFGDFSVGEFGGIDGRQNVLYVRLDGVALLISRMPAAGRLSEQALQQLQTLFFQAIQAGSGARGAAEITGTGAGLH